MSESKVSYIAPTTASTNAFLVGKFRHTVPTPTPARRATSSMGAFRPDSAKTDSAAARTRSRLRRASARLGPACVSVGGMARFNRKHGSDYSGDPEPRFHFPPKLVSPGVTYGRRDEEPGRSRVRSALVDARGPLLEPADRLRRQLEPERRHPDPFARAARHRV